MKEKWWERWPGRYQREIDALEKAGIRFQRDETAFANGILKLSVQYAVDGEDFSLTATYPDIFPYTRFELFAPDLELAHHQNPFLKNLCLLGRNSVHWDMDDTLADLLVHQFPKVLRAARNSKANEVIGIEENQGEPISTYYQFVKDWCLLVDSSWTVSREASHGQLVIGLPRKFEPRIRGAVLLVTDSRTGKVLAEADPRIRKLFSNTIEARWVRIPTAIRSQDPKVILAEVEKLHTHVRGTQWVELQGGKLDILGLIFPEELRYRQDSDGWGFLGRHKPNPRKSTNFPVEYFLIRPDRAGPSDFEVRVPELKSVRAKRVAVIGLGCVGALSAIEFARSGVRELRLIDSDVVESGTVVRWPVGLDARGRYKAEFLAEWLQENYPLTDVKHSVHRIGTVRELTVRDDASVLQETLDNIDLVFDATAEIGVQNFLSDLCSERHIPYICVSATNGGWGGRIVRIVPGKTGCSFCLRYALSDGQIPVPPGDDQWIQPEGCSDQTFTGCSFDVSELPLAGVRLAVATFCAQDDTGYPDNDWDVGILTLRTKKREAALPRWTTLRLVPHKECTRCQKN